MKRTALFTALMLFVALGASQTSSNIDISIKNTEPTPLQTSEYADIWLEVENTGSAEAQDFRVEFRENYPFTADGKSNWSISSLEPGETYQIHLQARVDENAVQGENQLEFRVETDDISFVEKVPVEVRSDRNVLAVKQIKFPDNVAPGSSSEMALKLSNLADSQLKNIEVSLDPTDLPFATSDSSTKNLEAVSSNESLWVNYTLNVDEGAENGVYKLPIDISFENEAGTEFTQSTTTGVTVGGTPDLEVGLNTEEALTDGTREITLRLVNRGHGSADFVSIKLQETDSIEVIGSNDIYIGSMDPDDFQTASFRVNIDSEQESGNPLEIPVNVTYTDRGGQKSEVQRVEAEVYTQGELRQYGIGGGNSILAVAVVVLVLVLGGAVYWRRKRK